MARTTASKAAGIDLLDRLYCNQLLVHLVFGEDERAWLRRIADRVREEASQVEPDGLKGERLRHWTVCLLEIFLADDTNHLAARLTAWLPALPEGVTPDSLAEFSGFNQKYLAALALITYGTTSGGDRHAPLDIALNIVDEFRAAPAAVRHRLAERVFALEFPDAPIEVFAWLAKTRVVTPAKFDVFRMQVPLAEATVLRAASLCEFEMMRSFAAGSMHVARGADRGLSENVLAAHGKQFSDDARERLLAFMQAEERRHNSIALRNGFGAFFEGRWLDRDYVTTFLANCHAMAPYLRAALGKVSTALSAIAGAMIAIRKTTLTPGKARYAQDGLQETIAHDVAALLLERGFKLNPRTPHDKVADTVREHAGSLLGYYRLLQEMGIVLPAQNGDIYRYYQVGHGEPLK